MESESCENIPLPSHGQGGGGASFLGLKRKQTMQLVATLPPSHVTVIRKISFKRDLTK